MSENTQVLRKASESVGNDRIVRRAEASPLLELLRRHKVAMVPLLCANTGRALKPNFAELPISETAYLDVLDKSQWAVRDKSMLLRAGLTPDLSTVGIFGKAIVHTETLWEALAFCREHMPYFHSSSQLLFQFKRGRFQLLLEDTLADRPGADEHRRYFIALLLYLVRQAKPAENANITIGYPGAIPAHAAILHDVRKIHNARPPFIEFDDTLLAEPLHHVDPHLSSVTQAIAGRHHLETPNMDDIQSLVRDMHVSSMKSNSQPVTIEDAAYLLDFSVRTLQVKLKSQKTGFGKLRDQARHTLARQALLDGHSIRDVSSMLGYAQRQNFSEAFTRWEGTAASVFASTAHRSAIERGQNRSQIKTPVLT